MPPHPSILSRRRTDRIRRLLGILIAIANATSVAAVWAAAEPGRPAPLPPTRPVVDAATGVDSLTLVRLTLGREQPYRYTLTYRGRLLPFRGHICYGFAGYNETCIDPGIEWLTPATKIELYAPGGVPRDLLEGYVMEVRYPVLSARTYRYALTERAGHRVP
ncbi:MAG: hypothetical protein RIB46_09265 [Pseudomonadales bacterium]